MTTSATSVPRPETPATGQDIAIRRSGDRGHANFGWLDSRHTFSFGQYHDPNHMGFGPLRVINDDRVAGGGGFPAHPHSDMEIVTYVLDGALEHKDSLGTGSVIRPGDVQRMTAGTGIRHSEFNASRTEPVHLLQIWVLPEARGLPPGYEQKTFAPDEKRNALRLIGSRNGRDGSVTIHQDVDLYATALEPGRLVAHDVANGRLAWVQVAKGTIDLNGHRLEPGDAAAVDRATRLTLTGVTAAEVLLFDMTP
jgi:redox-sensitive bicupin YhaK (pirin superfamily)